MVFGIDLDKSCGHKQKFDSIAVGHIFSLGRRSIAANQLGLTDVFIKACLVFCLVHVQRLVLVMLWLWVLWMLLPTLFSRELRRYSDYLLLFGSEWVKVECLIGGDRGFGQAVGRGSL